MANVIDKIPAETRWQIATKGLTGACTALMNGLQSAMGNENFVQFQQALWSQAGEGAKELAANLGIAAETPEEMNNVLTLLATASMGPECNFEVVEATENKCVGTATKCPWHERWREFGIKEDFCTSGHQAWGDGAVQSLNPNLSFKLTKNMVRGDSNCEWSVERKT
jgi:hypothetical protein